MKKLTLCSLLFTLLVTAVTFVSCRKHNPDVPDEDVVIGMMSSSVSGHSSTRSGIISDLAAFQNQGSFGVFGWKEATTPYSLLIFDNVEVKWNNPDNTLDAWQYSPIRYWDQSATKYYFGAYAPKLLSSFELPTGYTGPYLDHSGTTASSQAFIINDIPNWQLVNYGTVTESNNVKSYGVTDAANPPYDLMTAHSQGTPAYYLTEETIGSFTRQAGYVNLNFSHILAQLEFKVRYSSGPNNVTYRITGIEVGANTDGKKVPVGDGVTDFTYPFATAHDTDTPTGTYTFTSGGPASLLPTGTSLEVIPNSNPTVLGLVCNYLVVPFSVGNSGEIDMVVHYTSQYTGNGVTISPENHSTDAIPLRLDANTLLTSIVAGQKYTVTIVFDKGQVIDLLDVAVSIWQPGDEIDQPVYNW